MGWGGGWRGEGGAGFSKIKLCSQTDGGMTVPSSIPVTMDAKLSSSRIMSAACLLTSLPDIPIATPETSKRQ